MDADFRNNLGDYARLLRHWAWLIVLSAVLLGGLAYMFLDAREPSYRASTLVSIGSYLRTPNPNFNDLQAAMELTDTYVQLVGTSNIMRGTIEALDLPIGIGELRSAVSTRIVRNTSLMRIEVEYPDPQLAADIANTITDLLIENSPSNLSPELRSQATLARSQIAILQEQLEEQLREVEELDQLIETSTNADEQARLITQRNEVKEQINQTTATIAQFSDMVTRIEQSASSLNVIERAVPPTEPSGLSPVVGGAAAALAGAFMSAGAIILREYMDTTIKKPDQVQQMFGLPMLGQIMRVAHPRGEPAPLIIDAVDNFPMIEAYRMLQTNLLCKTGRQHNNVFLITSPSAGEGKSYIAANLAQSIALSGSRVTLVDADLRRPVLHQLFGRKNERGLSDLLQTEPGSSPGDQAQQAILKRYLQETRVKGLQLLTSGSLTDSPVERLDADILQQWLNHLCHITDVIIIDTPPVMLASETAVLAATIDASVLLVFEHRRTQPEAAEGAIEQITQVGGHVEGVVLNKAHISRDYYNYHA